MLRRVFNLSIFLILTIAGWYLNLRFQNPDLEKILYTLAAITAAYFVFEVLLEGLIANRIEDNKSRYTFRKTTDLLFFVITGIVALQIWLINPQALLVAYGLVAAGVAIALQDVFKNFAGAIAILMTGIYTVGDRIEVNGKTGDVIDIGLFYTTLLELREWVDGDQTTGRITMLPNGYVLFNTINNYTKDNQFIWDEISIPITHDSNWRKAEKELKALAKKKTAEITKIAEKEVRRLQQRYYLSARTMSPVVFVTPTDNWIMLRIRYVTEAHTSRAMRNNLHRSILSTLRKHSDIRIASETLTVTNI